MTANRFLSEDRPTESFHLGHYFGSLKNRLQLLKEGFGAYIIIADHQILTDSLDTPATENNIIELVKDYISIGLDPQKCTIFVQSYIPELAELTLLLSTLVSMNRVSSKPAIKEEISEIKVYNNFSLGMFLYPVYQAANILLFNPTVVPVGEDQLPHLELTGEIARKFNRQFGEFFTIPKPLLEDEPRLIGLDGNPKMSESLGNTIMLKDSPDAVIEKISKARTDSGNELVYDPVNKPNVSNLINLYSLNENKSITEVEDEFKNSNYREFKEELSKSITSFLTPIQRKRKGVSKKEVIEIIEKGNKTASVSARANMAKIKKIMNISYDF